MHNYKFYEILDEVLMPTIGYISSIKPEWKGIGEELKASVNGLKLSLYKKYQYRRNEFKKKYMAKGLKSRINRHKIAAVLYVSFIQVMEKNGFFRSGDNQRYLLAHNVILNTAIRIIEEFIYFDGGLRYHSKKYRQYVKKVGLVSQENTSHVNIKEYIAKHKENSMNEDELGLAINFHCLELRSKDEFEKWNKKFHAPMKNTTPKLKKHASKTIKSADVLSMNRYLGAALKMPFKIRKKI